MIVVGIVAATVTSIRGAAEAHPPLRFGGVGGVTLGPSEYFPTFLGGIVAETDIIQTSLVSIGGAARFQLYSHREEEDFGSWGAQADISLAVRLSMFDERDDHRSVVPFTALRAGGGLVGRVPRRDGDSSELIDGYLLGGSVGIAFHWREGQPRMHLQVSFDRPSFTTHDDKVGPVGELSVMFMTPVR